MRPAGRDPARADARAHPLTPFPEVNQLVELLAERIAGVLGDQRVGLYLDGSLARGGFDAASDIDFVAVTKAGVSEALFAALQAMHAEIGQLNLRLAQEIEGFYVAQEALRRYDPRHERFANIERGRGERLKWVEQGHSWIIHRYILREYGVVLSGPSPAELIDPISPDDLRRAMGAALTEWGGHIRRDPDTVAQAGYQPYAVLTLCRMLYTLETGDIVAKSAAAEWGRQTLERRWKPLIEAALADRLAGGRTPTRRAAEETLAFLEYAAAQLEAQGAHKPHAGDRVSC